ncbi:MAG: MgtC/SapB family protein [Methylophilaceae bacterium]|nr:MgtC/SapB family protein [Methylophilaceae bacterium]
MEISKLFAQGNGLQYLPMFVTSLALGLLIGLERERSAVAKAGLRTFTLVAMLGTLAALLAQETNSPWLLVAAWLGVGAMIIVAYLSGQAEGGDPGTTTEAALMLCFGLGAIVWYGYGTLAIMLAIVTTVLLHYKPELQSLSKRLTRQDIQSILQFAMLSFIILPVLPNHNYGPFQALNPYHIWLIVVLISGVSLAGYIALRIVGQRYGAPLLGFFGGLVSSTATTLVYARSSKSSAEMRRLAVVVILIANLVVLLRLGVISSVIAPNIIPHILPVLLGGFVLGALTTYLFWRKMSCGKESPMPEFTNPAEMKIALGFGFMYALVLLCAAWLSEYAGSGGLYALAFVSGLTDVDAIALSSLRLFDMSKIVADQAVLAITIAYLANLMFKFGLVVVVGGRDLAKLCAPSMLAIALGFAGALALQIAW